MKDTRHVFLVLLSSLLLMLTGCSRRDVLDDYPVSGVEIELDWNGVTNKLPEGVRAIFYPKNAQGRKIDTYLSVKGGKVKVPPGRYSVVIYNYDTETVLIRGEEAYETIEAYTGHCTGLGSGAEKMVWAPDPLYVVSLDDLRIENTEEVTQLELKPKLVVRTYAFSVKAVGLEYVASVMGVVDGMACCYNLGSRCRMDSSNPILFEMNKTPYGVEGCFSTFGVLDEMMTRAGETIKMTLAFVKTDNSVQTVKVDVTDVVIEAEKGSSSEEGGGEAPLDIELPIEEEIEIVKPDGPPPGGGGGIGGDVGGWGEGGEVELPLN